jgi:hypothetical protein
MMPRHLPHSSDEPPVDLSQLRDITDIEKVPTYVVTGVPLWVWFVLATLPLLVILLVVWWRRRTTPRKMPVPARQWALAQMDLLQSAPDSASSDVFHARLADIIRRYLEMRLEVPALRRATPELAAQLASSTLLTTEQRKQLLWLLERCDLAKFALVPFSAEECRATAQQAREFISTTDEPPVRQIHAGP